MVKITSREELEEWLNKQGRADFAQVIAARAALRALPYAFGERIDQKRVNRFAALIIHASAIPWAARNFPAHDMGGAARAAVAAGDAAADAAFAAEAAARAAANAAANAADAACAAANAAFTAARAAAAAAAAAARAAFAAANAAARAAFWDNINHDCNWLESEGDPSTAARRLTRVKLWPAAEPKGWGAAWDDAADRLRGLDQGYDIWIDWYNRRIKGERAVFDIPGDKRRVEDKKILTALADATNEDFWDKGATYVNTTLQGWIEEARHRVRPKDYKQNPLAIGFGANPAGEVDVLPDMAGNRVLRDDDARDRHHIARAEARAAFAASSRDLTQAFEFDAILSDYLSALGEDVEAIRPSMLVLCGDKLRRLRAEYRSPASSKPPLAEAQAFALENWERAHNALVGIDPFLSAIERQSYGPDVPVIVIQLDAIKAVIDNAREAGVASAAAQDVLTDTVANVPAGATPDERRYRFSIESLKNFIRGTADLARKHGGKAVVGGYGAALWMQRNVEWLRDLFVGEQSILDLINWIATLPL
jgi:hypothetical protein